MSGPILLTAGGTGGHVFPAEALAKALLARGHRLAFVTDPRGNAYAGSLGMLETFHVSSGQMSGRGILGKIDGLRRLIHGALQARRILKRLSPSVVVGFGGYASVPAVSAALWLGIPILLHEQNAVLGRANRLFAKRAACIAVSFETTRFLPESIPSVRSGSPVRDAILSAAEKPYFAPASNAPVVILILGGSQGSRVFSDVLPEAFKTMSPGLRARLRLFQQVRPEDMERVQNAYAGSGIEATLKTFFDDVPARLAECHLLISRSGASTLSEAAFAGRPSVLIPLPTAADDHQTANARAFEAVGAAWILPQRDMTPARCAALIEPLLNAPETLAAAAAAAASWSIPDAAERLAQNIEALIGNERSS